MAKKKPSIDLPYVEGQNLHSINTQDDHIQKYQSEILNIVNKHGHGNDAEIVGMVSQVIKEYRKSTQSPSLEGWIEYHSNLSDIKGIEVGVKKNWDQFQEMKKAIDAIDEDTLRYWLKNLVYNKTYAGLQAQDMVLKDIAERISTEKGQKYSYRNGDADDERAQIDGYIIDPTGKVCGLQVKSDSYQSHNTIEGSAPVQYVYYKLNPKNLSYNFDLDKLSFIEESEYDSIKKTAKDAAEQKQRKIEEREKRNEEKARKRAERERRRAEKESREDTEAFIRFFKDKPEFKDNLSVVKER